MFSDVVKAALEAEVVGQPRAVQTVVRGATRLVSGLTPRERKLCAWLFVGPTGTGKSHLVQALGRVLGIEARTVVVDCRDLLHGDPRLGLAAQVTRPAAPPTALPWASSAAGQPPAFGMVPGAAATLPATPPLRILQIDHPERGHPELPRVLATVLDTGRVPTADGSSGSLDNCLVVVTSGLCSAEILDEAPTIGFAGGADDARTDGHGNGHGDSLRQRCLTAVQHQLGTDLVGRLDDFEVFQRLREEDLGAILDLRTVRLDRWMARRGSRVQLEDSARTWLLARGCSDLRVGARELLRVHQEQVEFPLADLLVSGHVPPGSTVHIDRRGDEEHLHFTVDAGFAATRPIEIAIR